jgi:3-hydroxy acid dehydrogenase / malonic semialdehyde reductase
MSAPLAGRTAVVTGASLGIGRALACDLVAAGARVVAAARSVDKLQALAAELGSALVPVAADVADPAAVHRLAAAAGAVDVVVNNAGLGHVEPFLASDPARWRQTLDTNLIGALLVARAFLPGMLAAGRGLIVNVGSTSASGWPYLTLYAASKAGLRAASAALDREHAGRGIRFEYVEIGPTAGTGFGTHSDPEHLPAAGQAWTELGIDWRTVGAPETSARTIRTAIERALSS